VESSSGDTVGEFCSRDLSAETFWSTGWKLYLYRIGSLVSQLAEKVGYGDSSAHRCRSGLLSSYSFFCIMKTQRDLWWCTTLKTHREWCNLELTEHVQSTWRLSIWLNNLATIIPVESIVLFNRMCIKTPNCWRTWGGRKNVYYAQKW